MACPPESKITMPAIKARKQVDGSLRYTAVVRIRRQGKVLHQEAKTFAHRSAAERWGKHREVALEDPSALVRAQQPSTKLSKLIRWYIDSFQHISKWQRSKHYWSTRYVTPLGATSSQRAVAFCAAACSSMISNSHGGTVTFIDAGIVVLVSRSVPGPYAYVNVCGSPE